MIRQDREERERELEARTMRGFPTGMIVLDASAVVDLLIKPATETKALRRHLLRGRVDPLARAIGHRARVEVV